MATNEPRGSGEPVSVLFVCMGSICRSPMAEAMFLHHIRADGHQDRFRVDSAGTGDWHAGEPADPRMRAAARARGIAVESIARGITPADLDRFDLLVCMDRANRDGVLAIGGDPARVSLLLEWDAEADVEEVPDPYYGGDEGFIRVLELVDRATRRLLERLVRERLGGGPGALA